MKKLRISEEIALPLDTITSTTIVYGGKGMGKTNLGSVLVEELTAAGLRWSALDPMGVWWGLRHSKDGKGPGIKCLILGGPHGDIPIEPTGGIVCADLVVNEQVNVIIDFSRKQNGEMWAVGEKIRFVRDYGSRLFQQQGGLVNGKRREPLFQLIDEAARFVPQKFYSNQDDIAECLSVWARLVEEGRNIGLGICLLTQRSARLNKDVAELADAMFAFRTIGPNSLEAVLDWLGSHVAKERVKQLSELVRSLPVGNCLVVSPGWLQFEDVVSIRERETFDSSKTPKPGESTRRITGVGAKPDLEKYAERMRETIERAKENDPRELKAKIKQLSTQLEKLQKMPAPSAPKGTQPDLAKAVLKAIGPYRSGLEEAMKIIAKVTAVGFENTTIDPEQIKQVFDRAATQIAKMAEQKVESRVRELERMRSQIVAFKRRIDDLLENAEGDNKIAVSLKLNATDLQQATTQKKTPVRTPSSEEATQNGDVHLKTGAKQILSCLVQWFPEGMTEGQLRAQAGYKKSGTLSTYMSALRNAGFIRKENNLLYATQEAVDYFGGNVPDAPKTTDDVLAIWRSRLKDGAYKILEILVQQYPKVLTMDQICELSGYANSGTLSTYISNLVSARLANTQRGQGVSANAEALFL